MIQLEPSLRYCERAFTNNEADLDSTKRGTKKTTMEEENENFHDKKHGEERT